MIANLQGGEGAPTLAQVMSQAQQARAQPVALPAPASVPESTTGAPSFGAPPANLTKQWPNVDPRLLSLAGRFGATITSGFRDPEQNRAVGGAPGSYHMSGRAIDVAPGPAAAAMYGYALEHPELFAEAFFDPAKRYIKRGKIVPGAIGGHSDHYHFTLA
jgi:hypothetical protein